VRFILEVDVRFFLIKQSNNKIKPTFLSVSKIPNFIFDTNFKLEVDIILVNLEEPKATQPNPD